MLATQVPKPQKQTQNSNPNNTTQKTDKVRKAGIVRSVVSGDTLILLDVDEIRSNAQSGLAPREFSLALQGLRAPTLGKRIMKDGRNEKTSDKPFAWESREFLRSKVIGKPIVYFKEHERDGRAYGDVWVGEENMRLLIVENGFADVVQRKAEFMRDDDIALEAAKNKAIAARKGMWGPNSDNHVRRINYRDNTSRADDLFRYFEKIKNKQLKGVVEKVLSGSTLRVYIHESSDDVQVQLAGVQCPMYKPNCSERDYEDFSAEAKFFVEHVLLHRDVTVTVESIDKYNNFYANVVVRDMNVSLNLLTMGLARFVEWSASKSSDIQKYKEAERSAQQHRLRIWNSSQSQIASDEPQIVVGQAFQGSPLKSQGGRRQPRGPINEAGNKDTVQGTVVEIASPGIIIVRVTNANGTVEDKKIMFSSIRAPRLPRKEKEDDKKDDKKEEKSGSAPNSPSPAQAAQRAFEEAFAVEAKEWLRSNLIGKTVSCVFNYSSRPQNDKNAAPSLYWSVYVGDKNVAVDLVRKGYATVIPHGKDEVRSADFQDLIIAEKEAKKVSAGLNGPISKKPTNHVNDMTTPDDIPRTKYFLNFFKKTPRVTAVVEHVYSSSRYKLFIPSESCLINFCVQGCSTERPHRVEVPKNANKNDITFASYYPPITAGNRALLYARDHVLQRNVEVAISNIDKGGNFIGQLFVNKKDWALQLLADGQALLNYYSVQNTPFADKYDELAKKAEASKRGLHAAPRQGDIVVEDKFKKAPKKQRGEEVEGTSTSDAAESGEVSDKFDVAITEIIDGATFCYQKIGEETQSLNDMMESFQSVNWEEQAPYSPSDKDEYVAAQFSSDERWYRARVVRLIYPKKADPTPEELEASKGKKNEKGPKPVAEEFEIEYIDYGNKEVLKADKLRALPAKYSTSVLPRQAFDGKLVYIKPPSLKNEYGRDAAAYFKHLVWNKNLKAAQYNKGPVAQLTLGDPETGLPVNFAMVMAGLGRVHSRREDDSFVKRLLELQKQAKEKREGMWQYGEPDSDEE